MDFIEFLRRCAAYDFETQAQYRTGAILMNRLKEYRPDLYKRSDQMGQDLERAEFHVVGFLHWLALHWDDADIQVDDSDHGD